MKFVKRLGALFLCLLLVGVMTIPAMAADEPGTQDHNVEDVVDKEDPLTAENLAKRLLRSEDDLVAGSAKLRVTNPDQVATYDSDVTFWAGEREDHSDAIKLSGGGIILSTGDGKNALRQRQEAVGGYKDDSYQDEDLAGITNSAKQYDVVVLEFDVKTHGNMMTFNYVFASNEFDQKKIYKDTFGLFVEDKDGQMINVAKVNGREDKIMTINSLKGPEQAETVMASNDFYKVNKNFATCGFDGVSLVNKAYGYVPTSEAIATNETAHVKLVVADFEDSVYDSAVFIQAHCIETQSSVQGDMVQRVFNGKTTKDPVLVKAEDTLNYAVNVRNTSSVEAKNVKVSVAIPDDLELTEGSYIQHGGTVEDAPDQELTEEEEANVKLGVWDATSRVITWDLGNMLVNHYDDTSVVFSVKIPKTEEAKTWRLHAHIESDNGADMDTNEVLAIKDGNPNVILSKAQSINGDLATTESREIGPNDHVTYYITAFNNGRGEAANMKITDMIPEGLELVYGSISDGGVMLDDGILTWNVGKLRPGELITVQFECIAPETITPSLWKNTAEATFTTSNSIDPITVNSNTLVTDKDGQAIIAMSMTQKVNDMAATLNDLDVLSGQVLTYTMNVVNVGPGTAANVEVRAAIPEGLTLQEGTISDNGTLLRGDIMWSFDRMGAGESKTLTFKCVVPDTTGRMDYKSQSYATYTHANISDTASSSSNTVVAHKDGLPKLEVNSVFSLNGGSRTTDVLLVEAGDKVTYYMTVNNNGKGTAKNVKLSTIVPDGMKYIQGSASDDAVVVGNTLEWTFDEIGVGEGVTLSYTAEVPTTGEATTWTHTATATCNHTNTGAAATQTSNELIMKKDGVSEIDLLLKQSSGNSLTNDFLAVREGASMKYAVTMTNNGTGDAQNVVVYAIIPRGVTLDKNTLSKDGIYMIRAEDSDAPEFTGLMRLFSLSSETEQDAEGFVYWELGTVKAGKTITREFAGTIPMGSGTSNWASKAVATYGVSNDPDDIISQSNVVKAGVTEISTLTGVMSQKLNGNEKTTDTLHLRAGDKVTYEVVVKNPSDVDINEIKVLDAIPEGLAADASSISNDGVLKDGVITWTINKLASGDSRTLSFDVLVPDTTDGTTWKNKATITVANFDDVITNEISAVMGTGVPGVDQTPTPKPTDDPDDEDTSTTGTGTGTTGTGNGNGDNDNGGYQYNPNKDKTVKPGTGVEDDARTNMWVGVIVIAMIFALAGVGFGVYYKTTGKNPFKRLMSR